MPRPPTDKIAHTSNMDRTILATLTAVAQAGQRCPGDDALGEPHGWSRSQVARSLIRLTDRQKITCEIRGNRRVISILDLKIETAPFMSVKPTLDTRPKGSFHAIPENASRALTIIRRAGIVAFAERVSEQTTRVTGWYSVKGEYVTLDEILKMADKLESR